MSSMGFGQEHQRNKMLNDTNQDTKWGSTWAALLDERRSQDRNRDPLDALNDAEALYDLLVDASTLPAAQVQQNVSALLDDLATSYVLAARIRQDIALSDLAPAVAAARQLVDSNEQRYRAALQQP